MITLRRIAKESASLTLIYHAKKAMAKSTVLQITLTMSTIIWDKKINVKRVWIMIDETFARFIG